MQHERGHSHYRRLPQQTSTTSLFIVSSSISFLQFSSLSAHPSSARFPPLIPDCLSFLRLDKLALTGQSALTEDIWVQWSSVAPRVPLSNRNTSTSSRPSTRCPWIRQSCTRDCISVKLFTEKTNTMWNSGRNLFLNLSLLCFREYQAVCNTVTATDTCIVVHVLLSMRSEPSQRVPTSNALNAAAWSVALHVFHLFATHDTHTHIWIALSLQEREELHGILF